ncbi:unnamed protein product, partial [Candidula unifasciata]
FVHLFCTDQIQAVRRALDYVKSIHTETCRGGTGQKLILNFDHNSWIDYTQPATRTANFLSSIIALDGHLDRFNADVRNNVRGNSLIYGSAIALEPGVISDKQKFCPYACRDRANDTLVTFDIANGYDYQTNSTDWYDLLRTVSTRNISMVTDKFSSNGHTVPNLLRYPAVTYGDGKWTYPYFDCGGGNIWMSTYSSPIFSLSSADNLSFSGVATIDIELTNLNINQCDLQDDDDVKVFDIFRGTHSCQTTTSCVALNEGFTAGAYVCECKDGFYFPNASAILKAFRGRDIEEYFEHTNTSSSASQFQCLPCSRGCETCISATPCLYDVSTAVQALTIIIIAVMILGCSLISIVTSRNKKQLVIKTASPIFLHLMCLGAVLMCSSVLVMFGEATSLTCTLQIWPFHVGFTVMYGALLIKTWRISEIFRSGGARKRVNLPDKALLQRMLPLVVCVIIYLAIWTGIDPPVVVTEKTSSNLKFFTCSMSWWTYVMYSLEALLLLAGVYLCFTVRKAPAHFNESKFITWATYNAIILGSFVIMLTRLVGLSAGPDIVYILMMAQQQVFVTITMALIFTPKFWTLYKGVSGDSVMYSNHVMTITGRIKPTLAPVSPVYGGSLTVYKSVGVQCQPEDCLWSSTFQ